MKREDIIRMAREAGLPYMYQTGEVANLGLVEQFAHLVYEATFRDANIAASRTIVDAAVLEEREACAKLAEETVCDTHLPTGYRIYGTRVAKAIRERSNYSIEGIAQNCAAAIRARKAALAEPLEQGCEHCNQPLYAAVKCRMCGRVTSQQ